MFDLDACVAFLTNRVAKKLARHFNSQLLPMGVTRVQWFALYYLGASEGISQNELADLMDISASATARLIDRMERDGLVTRVKDPIDRRVFRLILTETGKRRREELLPEGEKMSNCCSEKISDEDLRIFIKVLRKLEESISRTEGC